MTPHRTRDALLAVPLFAELSPHDLDHLHRVATTLDLAAGTVLMEQGAIGQEMVVVVEGVLDVVRDDQHIADIGAGEVAGELALLCHRPRNSRVVAKTDVSVVHIDGRGFAALLEEVPQIAVRMLPIVARRVPASHTE